MLSIFTSITYQKICFIIATSTNGTDDIINYNSIDEMCWILLYNLQLFIFYSPSSSSFQTSDPVEGHLAVWTLKFNVISMKISMKKQLKYLITSLSPLLYTIQAELMATNRCNKLSIWFHVTLANRTPQICISKANILLFCLILWRRKSPIFRSHLDSAFFIRWVQNKPASLLRGLAGIFVLLKSELSKIY